MKKLFTPFLILSVFAIVSCNSNTNQDTPSTVETTEVNQVAQDLQTWSASVFATLPESFETDEFQLTEEKVALGKKLYYDKILSKDETISCNSCHDIKKYGVDQLATSPGNDGENGTRNSPTTFNAAAHIAQFWDGREPHVEAQAGGPVLNPVEMAMPNEEEVVARLEKHAEYPALFTEAFPNQDKAITYETMRLAIGAFERTLVTPSRFDKFIDGDLAQLNDTELAGLKDFKEVGCYTCHMGNSLGGNMFQKFGVYGNYWDMTKSEKVDEGKFEATGNESDKYIFKVPSLRNIEHTFPYFHDGSISDLGESVKIMAKTELNKELTEEQVANIVVFLKTLTGDIDEKWLEETPAS